MSTNPLKQAARYKELQLARGAAEKYSRDWWDLWKKGVFSDQSELNSAARKLDELAPGEGARLQAAIAMNALQDMLRKFSELTEECAHMRKRLSQIEERDQDGKNIVRSATTDSSSESSTLGTSGTEGV